MAGGADQGIAGPKADCARCASSVLQKSMIPDATSGTLRYLCKECARLELRTGIVADETGAAVLS